MRKYELLKSRDTILRVFEVEQDRVLVIDCIKQTMPVWVDRSETDYYSECSEEILQDVTGIELVEQKLLDAVQKKIMHHRYTMIAPVRNFIGDGKMRSQIILFVAGKYGVTKRTIRNYLCLYLAYMDITALAPKCKSVEKSLTKDEKNMRWALNKFFYTQKKNSLMTAYTMMLKEKYCSSVGELAESFPTFYQFRYFYRKTRKMQNVIADKHEWCGRFGISLPDGAWECNQLPAILVTDMGTEHTSENFEQIAELGVTVVNLPPYRPELKGTVEKFFDQIQETYKKHLKGKGVIELDFQERGAHDYRKDACLTLREFEKVILHCIIYYNSQRVIENFPYTEEMFAAGVKPCSSAIWNWSKEQVGANLITVEEQDLILTLLPRTTGKFSRYGLKVNKLR